MKKVLVVEDEASIRSFEVINLTRAGYSVSEAESGEEGLAILARDEEIKVALLDVMLPGIDGFEVCRQIRLNYPGVGVIMLTARSQEVDKVTGLITGADDYVTKPFSPTELIARVDALVRRLSSGTGTFLAVEDGSRIVDGPFEIDKRSHTLFKDGRAIKLTQMEFTIVCYLFENRNKALSREEILATVWGKEYFGEVKIVDVNMRRLRMKLEEDPQNPNYLTTVWGYGYKWGR